MTRVGLVVPPERGRVPPDAQAMFPDVDFLVEGLGVAGLSEAGYAEALARLDAACASLARRGATAILLFGTSLSFFRGPAFNADIEQRMKDASGLPCTTLTSALVEALRTVSARRLAVATAYRGDVNALFASYFSAEGFTIDAIAGLDIVSLSDAEEANPERIARLARQVREQAPLADAVVISCAGLSTHTICPGLEDAFGLPVLSSAMVGARAAVRLTGQAGRAPGFGRLYQA
ncbi:aspartate/glutamate racemase family protein [Aquibium carbonis]|uniref:arylmalonate decarboxylase n=1 Tax=Aquibium carbonis TaxID=2495581 RepID=UPI001FE095F3|nr:aspartate/glutamate racemase family protein [Aquibium carbonis]